MSPSRPVAGNTAALSPVAGVGAASFKTEPIQIDGKGRVVSEADRDRMLDDYYSERGWDKGGVPLAETLKKLGVE